MRDLSCIKKNLNSLCFYFKSWCYISAVYSCSFIYFSYCKDGFYVSLKAQQYACLLAYTSLPFHHSRTYFQIRVQSSVHSPGKVKKNKPRTVTSAGKLSRSPARGVALCGQREKWTEWKHLTFCQIIKAPRLVSCTTTNTYFCNIC